MEIIRSLILGAVQGVTEFLPISSSGHLVLVPYLFKWDYKGLGFDVALHFGTLIAIIVYFRKDWIGIISNTFAKSVKSSRAERGDLSEKIASSQVPRNDNIGYPQNLLWQIIIATIPAAIIGILINNIVEDYFHSPILIAINLAVFGIVLWLVDRYAKSSLEPKALSYKKSFIIGLAQSIALVPGISRSGITMIVSRGIGLKREEAARFSFLLGTPAMLGAFIFELKDISNEAVNAPFLLAVFSSAVFGFIAIKYLLQYLRRGNFGVFTIYRLVLAGVVVLVYLLK